MKSIFTYAIISILIASCSTNSPVTPDTSTSTNSESKSDASITRKNPGTPYQMVYEWPACGNDYYSIFEGTAVVDEIVKGNGKRVILEYNFQGTSSEGYVAVQHSTESWYYPNWPESCPCTWTYELQSSVTGPAGTCCYNITWVQEVDENCVVTYDVMTGPLHCDGSPY